MDVRVTIPYTALLGANDQPGEIAGYGPIPAAVARELAAGGTWRRVLTDPASDRPLDYGTTHHTSALTENTRTRLITLLGALSARSRRGVHSHATPSPSRSSPER